MQDGVAFFTFNDQGGPRGGRDYNVQNWWMGMATRPLAGGTLQLNAMFSLEPATLGSDGYREIFQAGETLDGLPLIDRQHPHEFLMQAAAVWRRPLRSNYVLTLAAAPVGEPALGPIAFMHRSSARENPTAPLAHHTLDSTHIAMGVVTAALSRGPFEFEASVFNGREPDEQRWDLFDPGALDSWATRVWFKPGKWMFQASHGLLREPEALEPGNVRRTTASAAWIGDTLSASVVYGRNDKSFAAYNVVVAEGTQALGRTRLFTRYEAVQVETFLLLTGSHNNIKSKVNANGGDLNSRDVVQALTLGGVRILSERGGWDLGVGGDATFYAVPSALLPIYESPVSFHLFVRIRPPSSGRMYDMTMTSPHAPRTPHHAAR